MIRLYTVAANAVTVVENGSVRTMLEDHGTRCVAASHEDPDTVYVGTSDEGLFKSPDGGESWDRLSGITHSRITAVAVSPVDGAVYAGTEPSSLFVSRDEGESWRELEGLKNLPSASTWSFPPRPWTEIRCETGPLLVGEVDGIGFSFSFTRAYTISRPSTLQNRLLVGTPCTLLPPGI